MTEQKFDEINDHFNQLMGENDLLDVMNVIDGESIKQEIKVINENGDEKIFIR